MVLFAYYGLKLFFGGEGMLFMGEGGVHYGFVWRGGNFWGGDGK